MGIIGTIVAGLIIGVLAKWVMPGKDPGGIIITIIIGIVGSFIGGFIASFLGLGEFGKFSLAGIGMGVVGAVVLLIGYRMIKNNS